MTHARLLALALVLIASSADAQSASTTRLWFPGPPTGGGIAALPGANVLRCAAWVPPEGITNATSITWYLTGGLGGGGLCSVTIYNADGSAQIRTSGAQNCSTTGVVSAAGLSAFSLTAGTKVQLCICGNAAGGSYVGAQPGDSTSIEVLQNVVSPQMTSAANPCIAGVAPVSTGARSGTTGGFPIGLLATDTP